MGKRDAVSPAEARAMLEMRASGATVPAIMARFGRSAATVWKSVRGVNPKRRGMSISPAFIAEIARMTAEGMPVLGIAAALKISERSVCKYRSECREHISIKPRLTVTVKTAGTGRSVLADPVPAAPLPKIGIRIPEHAQRMRLSLMARGMSDAEALAQAMRFYARDKAGSAVADRGISRAAGGGVVAPFHAENMPRGEAV